MINKQFYYSESEWDRLGCGPLPEERKSQQHPNPQDQYLVYPEDNDNDLPRNPFSVV